MNKSPIEKEKKAKSLKKSKSNDKEKPEKTAKGKKDKDKQAKPKKEKPEGMPKKPQTAYFLFCADKRAENKEKKFAAKELGDLFKALPDDEREKYKKKA